MKRSILETIDLLRSLKTGSISIILDDYLMEESLNIFIGSFENLKSLELIAFRH